MSSPGNNSSRWNDRIARARQLADETSPASDLLTFYAALAEYQQSLLEQWGAEIPSEPDASSVLEALDTRWVPGAVRDLVTWLPRVAPPGLREAAQAMRDVGEDEWHERLDLYLANPDAAADRFSETTIFVLETVLQPLAERVASARQEARAGSSGTIAAALPERASVGPRCPACGGPPVLGVLREEGHGARRALLCGLCHTEWDYLRLVCAGCGEQRFESLPVFTADQFPHVRIEACDTCRRYLKTIDLTKDGRAVPVVDDIATVSLDLWAREQGYARLRANLMAI